MRIRRVPPNMRPSKNVVGIRMNDRSGSLFEPAPEAPAQALGIPDGHVGPYVLGNGRMVYWTGRVAIGLRHHPPPRVDAARPRGMRSVQAAMSRSRSPSPTWRS
jgi:hypothetical protein